MIVYLAAEKFLLLRKQDDLPQPVPFDLQRRNDETYKNHFFVHGAFQGHLTYEGRRLFGEPPETPETLGDDMDDKVTALLRAKRFPPDLENAVKEAVARDEPLSLLMIDINHFKSVNDTHGHPVNDEVLRGCGELIAGRIRAKGKAYRYGGDEIAVLLPNFSAREGLALVEDIRAKMDARTLSSLKLHITVTVGLACVPDHTSTGEELLELADKALYQGKQLGRNLVRVSGEPATYKPVERSIDRKEARPEILSDAEKTNIRNAYFRRIAPECPRDGAFLRVIEANTVDYRTPSLIVSCPICGLQEMLEGSR
jgi:diguanylate cyclase (GGDEF)-like protein